jgi:hypothetical protein
MRAFVWAISRNQYSNSSKPLFRGLALCGISNHGMDWLTCHKAQNETAWAARVSGIVLNGFSRWCQNACPHIKRI